MSSNVIQFESRYYTSKIWCKIYRHILQKGTKKNITGILVHGAVITTKNFIMCFGKLLYIFLTIQSFILKAAQGNAISSYGIPDVDGEDMFDPQYETDNQGIEVR